MISAFSTNPNFPGSMTGTTGGLGTPGGDWYFISSLRWISFLFSSILRLISSTISLATSPAPFALVVVVVVRNIVLRRLPDDDFDVDEKTEDATREFLEEDTAAWCWRHTEEEEEEEAIVIIVLLPLCTTWWSPIQKCVVYLYL